MRYIDRSLICISEPICISNPSIGNLIEFLFSFPPFQLPEWLAVSIQFSRGHGSFFLEHLQQSGADLHHSCLWSRDEVNSD